MDGVPTSLTSARRQLLVASPHLRHYVATELATLERDLTRQNALPLRRLERADELRMNDQGLVQAKYRYLPDAFLQVCRRLGNGVPKVLLDLAGQSPQLPPAKRSPYRPLCSVTAAASVYNTLLQLRWPRLDGLLLLRDGRYKTLDAVLSPRTKHRFTNLEFLHRLLQELPASCRLQEATLHGRRLFVRCLSEDTLTLGAIPDARWRIGLYAACDESCRYGGRFAAWLYDDIAGSGVLLPLPQKLRKYARPRGEWGALMRQWQLVQQDARNWLTQLAASRRRLLWATPTEGDLRRLRTWLDRAWVPAGLGLDVTAAMSASVRRQFCPQNGLPLAFRDPQLWPSHLYAELSQRSMYDLSRALALVASRQLPMDRERAESLAQRIPSLTVS